MNRLKQFITEIHRRSLWQVLLIYCGAALVAYQAVQALTEGLGLPQWFPAFAIVLFIVGLPIVLATAFVHEVAPPVVTPAEPTPLTEAEATRVEAEAAAVHLETRRRHRFLTWRNAAATFVIVLAAWGVVATGWMLFGRGMDESATADDRPSVAVLPLENRSGLEEDEYFTDGVQDEILTRLSKIGGLSVRGRTSAMQYRDSPKNLRQIGEELNARYLLEGSVLRAGEMVRIIVQLVDARQDEHVWAGTYDRRLTLENLLSVQSTIAREIARRVRVELSADERDRIEKHPTTSLEAYQDYLRGRFFLSRRTQESLATGLRYFQSAASRDTAYAPAYSGIADCYTILASYGVLPAAEAVPMAREAAEKALQLDPALGEAHLSAAWVGFYINKGSEDLGPRFETAIELAPGLAMAYTWYAWYLASTEQYDKATVMIEKGLELDPLSLIINAAAGWVYMASGEVERAVTQLHASLELDRTFPRTHYWLGQAYVLEREFEKAVDHLSQAVQISGRLPQYVATLAYAYGMGGRQQEAEQLLRELEQRAADEYVPSYDLAVGYVGLRDTERAIQLLEQALDTRDPFLRYIRADPRLDPLRDHPPFQALLDKYE